MVLTNTPPDPLLDLDPWVGQRQCTFKFNVVDAVTEDVIGDIHPIRGASLTHDSGRTIKRSLNLSLGIRDTAAINPIQDRITVTMVFANGQTYPLGKYMFTEDELNKQTNGKLGRYSLNDEMFQIDQQIRRGINGASGNISTVIQKILSEFPNIKYDIEPSNFTTKESWPIGANRGTVLEALALSGGYFSPWFDNQGVFRLIRAFNPIDRIPEVDLDQGNRVLRNTITETNDLLTAPNIIVVISNVAASSTTATSPTATLGGTTPQAVGVARIPTTAPNSIANRGFEIPDVRTLQVTSPGQAQAVANALAQRQTVFERVTLTTPPDPRHDSYTVVHWDNEYWLELSWSMALVEGGAMNHMLRKAYRDR